MSKKLQSDARLFLQQAQAVAQQTNVPFQERFEKNNPLQVSSFQGMFDPTPLSPKEQNQLQLILFEHYTPGFIKEEQVAADLQQLLLLTSELRAIQKQALILQGQRIKQAQLLLRNYKDGAFTAWLLSTYGNRQTPYSILQYYELHQALPPLLRLEMEKLPRKAAYTLASRQGSLERKMQLIQQYSGENQKDFITLIQETFPALKPDKRRKTINAITLHAMTQLTKRLTRRQQALLSEERLYLRQLIVQLQAIAANNR